MILVELNFDVYFRFFGLICTDRSCHCGTNLTEKVNNQKITGEVFTVNRGNSGQKLQKIVDYEFRKNIGNSYIPLSSKNFD